MLVRPRTQSQLIRLADGSTIKLCAARLDPLAACPVEGESPHLSPDEHRRAQRFENISTARQYLGSHCLLNEALKKTLGDRFHPKEICRDKLGKPFLPGHPVHFSLSRSDDFAVVGVSSVRAIGIDIETRLDPATANEVAPRILHPDELKDFSPLPDSEKAGILTRYWCLKEAILKASGEGLTRDPREIWLAVTNEFHRLLALPASYGPVDEWQTGETAMEKDFPVVYWAVRR